MLDKEKYDLYLNELSETLKRMYADLPEWKWLDFRPACGII